MDDAGARWKGQDVDASRMAAGQGMNLSTAAGSKLAPGPNHQRQTRQRKGGEHQGGGLGKHGDRGDRRRHRISLSSRAAR